MNIDSVGDIASLIDAPEESLVIDVGCKCGREACSFKQKGYRVIGVDDSVNNLVKARRKNPKIDFILSKPEDFKLSQNADVIFSNSLFHCVDEENQLRMLKNFNANLKEGGSLVCEFYGKGSSEFIHYSLWENFAEHSLNYEIPNYFPSLEQYKKILETAGFKVEHADVVSCSSSSKSDEELADWITDNVTKPFEEVSEEVKKEIVRKTADDLKCVRAKDSSSNVDFVRIRIKAEKESAA